MQKILIIGANGQLGKDLVLHFRNLGMEVLAADLPALDITDPAQTDSFVRQCVPELIINPAAFTAVDACEEKPELAFKVNRDGAGNVARAAAAVGARLVHFSTDYVFDGTKGAPYVESDPPNPVSVYGKSKYAGEQEVAGALPRHYIVRIAWLYGMYGNNFVKTIRKVAEKNSESGAPLKVVNDQFGSPTYTREVCRQVARLVETGDFGLYHATNEGVCSWFEFAETIVKRWTPNLAVHPCSTEQFPRPAPRPAFGVLENDRLKQSKINLMADWREAFESFTRDERNATASATEE
jgi:dTDP-4-dehydrorhamnose reductase